VTAGERAGVGGHARACLAGGQVDDTPSRHGDVHLVRTVRTVRIVGDGTPPVGDQRPHRRDGAEQPVRPGRPDQAGLVAQPDPRSVGAAQLGQPRHLDHHGHQQRDHRHQGQRGHDRRRAAEQRGRHHAGDRHRGERLDQRPEQGGPGQQPLAAFREPPPHAGPSHLQVPLDRPRLLAQQVAGRLGAELPGGQLGFVGHRGRHALDRQADTQLAVLGHAPLVPAAGGPDDVGAQEHGGHVERRETLVGMEVQPAAEPEVALDDVADAEPARTQVEDLHAALQHIGAGGGQAGVDVAQQLGMDLVAGLEHADELPPAHLEGGVEGGRRALVEVPLGDDPDAVGVAGGGGDRDVVGGRVVVAHDDQHLERRVVELGQAVEGAAEHRVLATRRHQQRERGRRLLGGTTEAALTQRLGRQPEVDHAAQPGGAHHGEPHSGEAQQSPGTGEVAEVQVTGIVAAIARRRTGLGRDRPLRTFGTDGRPVDRRDLHVTLGGRRQQRLGVVAERRRAGTRSPARDETHHQPDAGGEKREAARASAVTHEPALPAAAGPDGPATPQLTPPLDSRHRCLRRQRPRMLARPPRGVKHHGQPSSTRNKTRARCHRGGRGPHEGERFW
jgi:hypothetical protein